MLIRRLYKQGNSLVISLPGWLVEQVNMKVGDEFVVEAIGKTEIRLRPRAVEEAINRRAGARSDG